MNYHLFDLEYNKYGIRWTWNIKSENDVASYNLVLKSHNYFRHQVGTR